MRLLAAGALALSACAAQAADGPLDFVFTSEATPAGDAAGTFASFEEEAVVLRELEAFAEDLATNQLGRYRTAYPTFACVELAADQRITGADVFRFTKDGESVRVPDGVLQLR